MLSTIDQIGYLAAAWTLPAFRGRGVHMALIARRLTDALHASCEFGSGQTDLGSASQRNQERAGFKLAHVREMWTNA